MRINTTAKDVHEELKKEMPEIYPQRYQGYKVDSVNYNVIVSDIETYWNTEARFREGFKGDDENKVVTIPNFFTKINGIYKDKKKYIEFVKMLRESSNTVTLSESYYGTNLLETSDAFCENRGKNYDKNNFEIDYLNHTVYDYVVAPTIQNVLSGSIYCFRIKNSPAFTFEYLTSDKKQLVLDVLDRILMNPNNDLKLKTISDYMNLISIALTLDMKFINMINNFDYGLEIPKIVVSKIDFSKETAMFLYLMNEMGIDIVILSPNGKSNIEKYYDINNISLGFFDSEFDLETQIVLDIDKEKIKQEKKEAQKEKRDNFIEELCFPYCIWGPLLLILTIIGEVLRWNGFVNTGIQLVSLIIFIILQCLFCESNEKLPILTTLYGVLIAIFIVILSVRGIYALYCAETNPQSSTYYYSGFQIIEEEENISENFTIHQRDDAVILAESYKTMYYYLENNSRNQFDIVFEIWLNNNRIYCSSKMEPITYTQVLYLDTYLPDGDTTLTVKYYKDEGYDAKSESNVVIGEQDFTVHVLTEEETEEIKNKISEDGATTVYDYEIN